MPVSLDPIGVVHSCFTDKFGIPRQAGVAPAAKAALELFPPFGNAESLRGLADFSHIWVIFLFHEHVHKRRRSTVRPPRLGGNERVGVFASRSGFRPNAIGMSAVRLDEIVLSPPPVRLLVSGVDILDQTPVLDIKPYIPYADSLADCAGGFAPGPPPAVLSVEFSEDADRGCRERETAIPMLRDLIIQILQNDPRPAYYGRKPKKEDFGFRIYDLEIKWTCRDKTALVTAIERASVPTDCRDSVFRP